MHHLRRTLLNRLFPSTDLHSILLSPFLLFSFRRKIAALFHRGRIRLKLRGRAKSLGRAFKPSSFLTFYRWPSFFTPYDPQWSQFPFSNSERIVLSCREQCRHSDVVRTYSLSPSAAQVSSSRFLLEHLSFVNVHLDAFRRRHSWCNSCRNGILPSVLIQRLFDRSNRRFAHYRSSFDFDPLSIRASNSDCWTFVKRNLASWMCTCIVYKIRDRLINSDRR